MCTISLPLLTCNKKTHLVDKGGKREAGVEGGAIITHLLYVDDILIFGHGGNQELQKNKYILKKYHSSTSMEINLTKSSIFINEVSKEKENVFEELFPLSMLDLEQEFKYLGFNLKPNQNKFYISVPFE